MDRIFQASLRPCVVAIVLAMLTSAFVCGETIDFTWTSSGTFNGSPVSGSIVMQFTSSAPFDFVESRGTYTGDVPARRSFGPFEITARGGDKLLGSIEVFNSEPYHVGMNFGSGTFTFTGGTGQFAGATGHGTVDVVTTLPTFPTSTGGVEQEMRGMLSLVSRTVSGDYNDDGTVDAADYVVWRENDGSPAGYDMWRANFGVMAAASAASRAATPHFVGAGPPRLGGPTAAVPEPTSSTLGVVAAGLIWVAFTRRLASVPSFPSDWRLL
jgi:hypothetical protein